MAKKRTKKTEAPLPQVGMTSEQAGILLLEHGPNRLPEPTPDPLFRKIQAAVLEPMSLLLIVAALVAGFALREPIDAAAILVIVMLNITIGITQDAKSGRALKELEKLQHPTAKVIRDRVPRQVAAAEIVPGDLVVLAAGDSVPADGKLVMAASLSIDEALLTGESLPVTHAVGDDIFAGTMVTRGAGRMVVVETGPATRLGVIAEGLDQPKPTTPLQEDLSVLSARLGTIAVGLAVLVFAVLGLTGKGWNEAFLTGVALAVAAVPEGLPTAVVLALALGVRRMARRGAIVRKLPAVETLGSATAILTDKTGTLTHNRIRAWSVLDASGISHPLDQLPPKLRAEVATVAIVVNDAELLPAMGDAIDIGLLEAFPDLVNRIRSAYTRQVELPFDSDLRRHTVVVTSANSAWWLMTKGAPEEVISRCSRALNIDGTTNPLSDEEKDRLLRLADSDAGAGNRLIAVARRSLGEAPARITDVERDLVLIGILRLSDPVRGSAVATIAAAQRAGLAVMMVTGDHPGTAAQVAREVGLGTSTMLGSEIRDLGIPIDPLEHSVYARVEPDQKLALTQRLQEMDHVVAVTGDGVNDAPALRAANIGVAMGGSGSEVARQAGDMIITDDDLGTVIEAIAEGRTIYDNIRKVVEYLVGGNISELIVMLAGLLLLPGIGIPLLPLQLLWINLLTDGLPALALGIDQGSPKLMERPPRSPNQALLDAPRFRILGARGALIAAAALFIGWFALHQGSSADMARSAMFTTLVISHLGYALVVRLPSTGVNPAVFSAIGAGMLFQVIAMYWTPLREVLDLRPAGLIEWMWMVAAAATPLIIMWGWNLFAGRASDRAPAPSEASESAGRP